jgi:hypothetical protein
MSILRWPCQHILLRISDRFSEVGCFDLGLEKESPTATPVGPAFGQLAPLLDLVQDENCLVPEESAQNLSGFSFGVLASRAPYFI